jgi:hypothetical protein
MPASATVDLAKLAMNESDASAITVDPASTTINPYIYDKTTTGATVEAIVAPHSGAGNFTGREFKFTAGGKEYTYKDLADTFTFEAGKVYNFTFTLMPQGLQTNTPDGLTNCYLIPPGGSVEIPISRAINYGGMSADAAATVAVLWDDNSVVSIPTGGALTGSGASRTFTVGATHSTKQGNAVVALKVGTTIYWSWHIWVSNYNNQVWTYDGYTFMDRNLGATEACLTTDAQALASHGLKYQWGRKDPFPGRKIGTAGHAALIKFFGIDLSGSGGQTLEYVTNGSTDQNGIDDGILESIRKPTTFFSSKNNKKNWLPQKYDALWNNIKKTVWDPCPIGWRVPIKIDNINLPYKTFTPTTWSEDDRAGADWGTNAVYAANGLIREGKYGNNTNYFIYIWTGDFQYENGACFSASWDASVVYPNWWYRHVGMGVRCVQE